MSTLLGLLLTVVVGVHDGDTLRLSTGVIVRLWGIDAPELLQPYGAEAKAKLSGLVLAKNLRLEIRGRDRYGRTLGVLWLGRRNVNQFMIVNGLAWHYRRYAPCARAHAAGCVLERLEDNAQRSRRGLWESKEAIPPWEWRRLHAQ